MAELSHGWHRLLIKLGSGSAPAWLNPLQGYVAASFTIVPLMDGLGWAFSVPPELPMGAAVVDGPFLHMLQLLGSLELNNDEKPRQNSATTTTLSKRTSPRPGIPTPPPGSSNPDPFPITPQTAPSPDEGVFRVLLASPFNNQPAAGTGSSSRSALPPPPVPLYVQWEPISTQHGAFGGRDLGGNFDSYYALVVFSPSNQTVSVLARYYSGVTIFLDGAAIFSAPSNTVSTRYLREMLPLPGLASVPLSRGWHRLVFKMHAALDFTLATVRYSSNVSFQEVASLCSQQSKDPCGLEAYCPLPGLGPRLDGGVAAGGVNGNLMWAPVVVASPSGAGAGAGSAEGTKNTSSASTASASAYWLQVGRASSPPGAPDEQPCSLRKAASATTAMLPTSSSAAKPVVACCGAHPAPVLQVQLEGRGLGWAYDMPTRRVIPATPVITIVNPTSNTPLIKITTISVRARIFYTVDGSRPGPHHGTEYRDNSGSSSSSGSSQQQQRKSGFVVHRNVTITAVAISSANGRASGLAVLWVPIIQSKRLRRQYTVAGAAMQTFVDGGVDPGFLLFLLPAELQPHVDLRTFAEAKQMVRAGVSPTDFIVVDIERRVRIPPLSLKGKQQQQHQKQQPRKYSIYAFDADPVLGPANAPADLLDGQLSVQAPSFSPRATAVNQPTTIHFSGDGGLVPADTVFFPPPYFASARCYAGLCLYPHLTGASSVTRLAPNSNKKNDQNKDDFNKAVPTSTLTLFPMTGSFSCLCVLLSGGGARSDFREWAALANPATTMTVSSHAQNASVINKVYPAVVGSGSEVFFDGTFRLPASGDPTAAVSISFSGGVTTDAQKTVPSCAAITVATPTKLGCRVTVPSSVSGAWRATVTVSGRAAVGAEASVLAAGVFFVPEPPLPLQVTGSCAAHSNQCRSGTIITLVGSRFDLAVVSNNIVDLEDTDKEKHSEQRAQQFGDYLNLPITCVPQSASAVENSAFLQNKSLSEAVECKLSIPRAMQSLLEKYATAQTPFVFTIAARVTVGKGYASRWSRTGGSIVLGLGDKPGWRAAAAAGTKSPGKGSGGHAVLHGNSTAHDSLDEVQVAVLVMGVLLVSGFTIAVVVFYVRRARTGATGGDGTAATPAPGARRNQQRQQQQSRSAPARQQRSNNDSAPNLMSPRGTGGDGEEESVELQELQAGLMN